MFNNNQNKPPGFTLPQPEQQQNEWNINNMPWASSNSQEGTSSAVMQFNGAPSLPPTTSRSVLPQQPMPGPSWSGNIRDPPARLPRTKRRSESEDTIPAKHFISEERMIAHLSTLRLTDGATEDDVNLEQSDDEAEMEPTYPVNLTPQELEQRLKNASRITVCDSVRETLRQNQDILPQVLLDRNQHPCQALVLWTPPSHMERLLVGYDPPRSSSSEEELDEAGYYMDDNNNNNDPNNNNGGDEDMDL